MKRVEKKIKKQLKIELNNCLELRKEKGKKKEGLYTHRLHFCMRKRKGKKEEKEEKNSFQNRVDIYLEIF